jgi:hypothetical protein
LFSDVQVVPPEEIENVSRGVTSGNIQDLAWLSIFPPGKHSLAYKYPSPIRRPPNDFSIVGDGSSNGVHEHDGGLHILEGLPDGLGSIVLISRCGFVSLQLVVGARQLVQMLAEGRSG